MLKMACVIEYKAIDNQQKLKVVLKNSIVYILGIVLFFRVG